jgi:hypothetical protein
MIFFTEQGFLWAGSFGTEYIQRSQDDALLAFTCIQSYFPVVPPRVEHLQTLACGQRLPHVDRDFVSLLSSQGGLFYGILGVTVFIFCIVSSL